MKTSAQLTGRLVRATAATRSVAGSTARSSNRFASDHAVVSETAPPSRSRAT